jgi:lipid-A-disaccharide synthase-like uncharacterized protein
MPDLMLTVLERIRAEAVGLIGGAIFLGSWILQAWESRRAGTSVVSERFFWLRSAACLLLIVQGIALQSISLTAVMFGTLLLMLYNIMLLRRRR